MTSRSAAHEILPLFVERWSPRAMDGTALSQAELLRLFEAARWSPSAGNLQPWRFVYGVRGTPEFGALFDLLDEGNREWCKHAGALVVALSRKERDVGKPNRTHALDAGAAWMSLALQGWTMGLVVHGMGGFDNVRARDVVGAPEDCEVQHMIAIGHPGPLENLSEKNRARETPSDRKAVESFIFEGRFR